MTTTTANRPDLQEGEAFAAFTYQGRRWNGSKLVYAYLDAGTARWWGKPLMPGLAVGTTLEVVTTAGGTVYTAGSKAPRVTGMTDHPEAVEWSARDLGAAAEVARRSAARKVSSRLEDLLKELEDASHHLTRTERRALALRVLQVVGL